MNTIFLFPGQGVQNVGMGKDIYKYFSEVRTLFDMCSDITGKDLVKLLFDSDETELNSTENTQIAVTLINLSVFSVLKQQGIVPNSVAGFSLGEYAALAAAGVVSMSEVFDLVVCRGKIMERVAQEITDKHDSEGALGMTAILGMHPNEILSCLHEWQIPNVYLSMYNSPVQGVIGGTLKAREIVINRLKERGMKRSIHLNVVGPFHTPLMEHACDLFDEQTQHITFADPQITVYSNVNGERITSGAELRSLCLKQMVNPVMWIQEETSVWKEHPDLILEVGYGNVLSGLWKAWRKAQNEEHIPECISVGTVESIKILEDYK